MRTHISPSIGILSDPLREFFLRRIAELTGVLLVLIAFFTLLALASWSSHDPSLTYASNSIVQNWLGKPGAIVADLVMQMIGLAAIGLLVPIIYWGWQLTTGHVLRRANLRIGCWILGTISFSAFLSVLPVTSRWPLPTGLGGVIGDAMVFVPKVVFGTGIIATVAAGLVFALAAILTLKIALTQPVPHALEADDELSPTPSELKPSTASGDSENLVHDPDGEPTRTIILFGALVHAVISLKAKLKRLSSSASGGRRSKSQFTRSEPILDRENSNSHRQNEEFEYTRVHDAEADQYDDTDKFENSQDETLDERYPLDEGQDVQANQPSRVTPAVATLKQGKRIFREAQPTMWSSDSYELPPLVILAQPKVKKNTTLSEDALEQNARLLEGVLEDFGVRGEIIQVRPGPVVTLYELEPAAGVKSSRVIGLAEDIARSMSAISARVAVVSGRNAIGIELPNQQRETVYLRELLASDNFERSKSKLAICLGKTIGGEPVITDLARMPHLLVAGTTGSGKSVAINTMILSLLYRLKPDQCKLIMIDPKMLELSVYDGIPHLLTPVVTDPKKAVVALKWAVREMEDRYQKMSKLGVRNIDGFNTRVAEAKKKGKTLTRTVQTGFDRETGEAIYEEEEFDLNVLPFIVIIVDEMADLMMVAGKDIEGAIQRLAQMARAAGIHLVMATQRPSVDVITGTIKANFPTRISFQVTSKIDSRTILGEQGAEQLLGQGDMLYMAGGGRISRVHGPFVTDDEVEEIVAHLKQQGQPEYLDAITIDEEPDEEQDSKSPVVPGSMDEEEALSLYDRAVAIVLRDQRCSTSYIQRRLSVGYNKAASLVEQMEEEGVISAANHAGKREILVGNGVDRIPNEAPEV